MQLKIQNLYVIIVKYIELCAILLERLAPLNPKTKVETMIVRCKIENFGLIGQI